MTTPAEAQTAVTNATKTGSPVISKTILASVLTTIVASITTVYAVLAPIDSPTFTGTPRGPTAAVDTNTTQLSTTAFVLGQAGTANPAMDSTAAPGSSLRYSRQDHVHPSDTKLITPLTATRATLTSTIIPSTINTIVLSGYATTGDRGAGAIYIRGTAGGLLAVQSADGGYWNLASSQAYNVGFFGAKCDNSTNDSTAIQAAVTAAQPGGQVFLPALCAITSTITVSGSGYVSIYGTGQFSGLSPIAAIDGIDINTVGSVLISNMSIIYPGTGAAVNTNAIAVNAPGGSENFYSQISNVSIQFPYYGVNFIRAKGYVLKDYTIVGVGGNCIGVANLTNVDSGDGTVYGGTCADVVGACVYWQSGGGLRYNNNKCLVANNGITLALASGATTGTLLFTNNSIENITNACIYAQRQGVTGVLDKLIINGNECFTVGAAGQTYFLQVPNDAAGAWLLSVSMIGGNFHSVAAGTNIMADVDSTKAFIANGISIIAGGISTLPFVIHAGVTGGVLGPIICTGAACGISIDAGAGMTHIAPW